MAAVDMAKVFALCSPTEFEDCNRALHQCQGFLAQLYENVDDKTLETQALPWSGMGIRVRGEQKVNMAQ
jgi:hypothetical protein